MKVLLTIYDINDYGGIIGDIEYLARGLREHGHTVDLICLRNVDRDPYRKRFQKAQPGDYPSVFGGTCNTLRGWDGIRVFGYGTPSRVRQIQAKMLEYDLVIHEIPSPKEEDWPLAREIYRTDVNQIIAAHDAHFREHYYWINDVAPYITAITCTNHAGYVALEHCEIPRAFIGAAHEVALWEGLKSWEGRHANVICAHVWKAWKQMHKVVAAGPLLSPRTTLIMGGDGIEGRYMRSVDKCKPKYEGLWPAFTESPRCEYEKLMSESGLKDEYAVGRVMIDMSFSKKFARLGNHFNRSIIEAANYGCVAICTTENMRENSPQVPLFEDDVTHVAVPADSDPQYLADVMEWAANDMHPDDHGTMVAAVRQVLSDHFDYRKTSLQYLDLAQGRPAGIYPVLETGKKPG